MYLYPSDFDDFEFSLWSVDTYINNGQALFRTSVNTRQFVWKVQGTNNRVDSETLFF